MSDLILALKLVHVLGAAVLFGTGAGIAFFMLMAHRTRDAATIAATARVVVIADFVFTASAVVAQPLTGAALAWRHRLPAIRALDRAVACALRAGRAVLAAGDLDPDPPARYRNRGCPAGQCASPAIFLALSRLVCARLAGIFRRDRNIRPDDLETAAWLTATIRRLTGWGTVV